MSISRPTQRLVPRGAKSRIIPEFRLLAFDPGGTTGWCGIHCAGGSASSLSVGDFKVNVGQLGPHEHHSELDEFLYAEFDYWGTRLHVATESFTFRQFATDESYGRPKVELISCEYIGILKLFASNNGVPIASWMSSEGKGFCPDHKLEALGWFQKPKTPKRHINDSLRIAVSYLVKNLHITSPLTDTWRDYED